MADLTARLRAARRRPLFDADALPLVDYGRDVVHTHLPHRGPMSLVDGVVGFDPTTGRARGVRHIAASDPGFDGHFPDAPVYPGVLAVEMVGQLALLAASLRRGTASVRDVRLTRVIEASFCAPITPDTDATLLSEPVADDDFLLTSVGQLLTGDTVACVCAFEAMWIG